VPSAIFTLRVFIPALAICSPKGIMSSTEKMAPNKKSRKKEQPPSLPSVAAPLLFARTKRAATLGKGTKKGLQMARPARFVLF